MEGNDDQPYETENELRRRDIIERFEKNPKPAPPPPDIDAILTAAIEKSKQDSKAVAIINTFLQEVHIESLSNATQNLRLLSSENEKFRQYLASLFNPLHHVLIIGEIIDGHIETDSFTVPAVWQLVMTRDLDLWICRRYCEDIRIYPYEMPEKARFYILNTLHQLKDPIQAVLCLVNTFGSNP